MPPSRARRRPRSRAAGTISGPLRPTAAAPLSDAGRSPASSAGTTSSGSRAHVRSWSDPARIPVPERHHGTSSASPPSTRRRRTRRRPFRARTRRSRGRPTERRVRRDPALGGEAAPLHRPQPQRPGRDRPAPLPAPRGPRPRPRAAHPADHPRRPRHGSRRHLPARLHAPPASPAGPPRPSPTRTSGPWPATSTGGTTPSTAPPSRPSGPARRSSLPLDPDTAAHDLGFPTRFQNSLDAVSDRDFVAEALFICALTMVHLFPIGEELVLWCTDEFGFARLADEYATGSSMLPPEEEPRRRRAGPRQDRPCHRRPHRPARHLKGLPLAYNRDLQEDKPPLFDALDTCRLAVRALRGALATLTFEAERMRAAADQPDMAATDLAEHLVAPGRPLPGGPRHDRQDAGPTLTRRAGPTPRPGGHTTRGWPTPKPSSNPATPWPGAPPPASRTRSGPARRARRHLQHQQAWLEA